MQQLLKMDLAWQASLMQCFPTGAVCKQVPSGKQ